MPEKNDVVEQAMVEVLSEEMKALGLTPRQTQQFVVRIGRLATELENIRPMLMGVYRELEVRRRMALITNPKPSLMRRAAGAVASGLGGVASTVAGMFRRKSRWEQPPEKWSIPMLKAKLEELGGTPLGGEVRTIKVALR